MWLLVCNYVNTLNKQPWLFVLLLFKLHCLPCFESHFLISLCGSLRKNVCWISSKALWNALLNWRCCTNCELLMEPMKRISLLYFHLKHFVSVHLSACYIHQFRFKHENCLPWVGPQYIIKLYWSSWERWLTLQIAAFLTSSAWYPESLEVFTQSPCTNHWFLPSSEFEALVVRKLALTVCNRSL